VITQIWEALAAGGLEPTPQDVGDFLYLAAWLAHQESVPAFAPQTRSVPPIADHGGTADGVESGGPEPDLPEPSPIVRDLALGDPLALGRAFRPARVRKPSPDRVVLDEEATARQAAETGRWEPVTRPEYVRWPDLALVVDATPSMDIWSGPLRELRLLLERLGAFREIRSWRLAPSCHQGGPGVVPGLLEPDGGWRDAATTLTDPTGRRVILVVTDGADPAWRGRYARLLARWADTNPVGVLSVVPPWQWRPEGLHTQPGHIYASQSMAPNSSWHHRRHGRATADPGKPPIPVVELLPAQAEQLATAFAGGRRWVTTRLLDLSPGAAVVSGRGRADQDLSPYDRVAAFRGAASSEAFRLLTDLSAVPLTPDVIEQVRRTRHPKTGPAQLAEVLLSDLVVHLVDHAGDHVGDRYVFRDSHVRDVLRRRLEPAEAASVRLRAYHETRTGRELFERPDGDPDVIAFVHGLPRDGLHALAIIGMGAARRLAVVREVLSRLSRTHGLATTEPLVLAAAGLVGGGQAEAADRLRAAREQAAGGLVLVESLGALLDRDDPDARFAARAVVAALGEQGPGQSPIALGGLARRVQAVLEHSRYLAHSPDPAALLPRSHILTLPSGPADQAYEICRGLLRGDRLALPPELEYALWQALSEVYRTVRFAQDRVDEAARQTYRALVLRWREVAVNSAGLTGTDVRAAAAQVIEEWE
jgi:hypothetical protein